MDISEVRKQKKMLEEGIKALVETFSDVTGVNVTEIHLSTNPVIGREIHNYYVCVKGEL